MPEDCIRVPCSSHRRSSNTYAKLLTRVDPQAETGFGFEGSIIRPGKEVHWDALWPTPAHPRIPILLECAGSAKPGWGSRREPDVYILWRFDPQVKLWTELARSSSHTGAWAYDLRAPAIRALEESTGSSLAVFGDYEAVVTRLDHLLTHELGKLPSSERGRAVGFLHDQFCARLVRFELQ
jgi:hypothetical protein